MRMTSVLRAAPLLALLAVLACSALACAAGNTLPAVDSTSAAPRRLLHNGVEHDDAPSGDSPAPNLRSDRLVSNKGGAMAVFFIVPFIGCWVPFFIPVSAELLKYGILFAAGLFFTLALEHLTSDSAGGFGDLTSDPYPYAYLLVVCGYMVTFFCDLIVQSTWARNAKRSSQDQFITNGRSADPDGVVVTCCKGCTPAAAPLTSEKTRILSCTGQGCGCNGQNCSCSPPSALEFSTPAHIVRMGASLEGQHDHHHHPSMDKVKELALADLVLLVFALCFHAIFEGLAIGLTDTVFHVWNLTLTIVLHKFFEGAALGTSLTAQKRDRSWLVFFLYAFGFSITAPVGIAIGIILDSTEEPRSAQWVETIGNGFAAGVFIYVAISHLLVKSFRPGPRDRWFTPFLKWGFLALGVLTLSLLEMRQS